MLLASSAVRPSGLAARPVVKAVEPRVLPKSVTRVRDPPKGPVPAIVRPVAKAVVGPSVRRVLLCSAAVVAVVVEVAARLRPIACLANTAVVPALVDE